MPQLPVGLVQINGTYHQKYFLPYSVGMLQAYALQNPDLKQRFAFLPPIFYPLAVSLALEWLHSAVIVGFSVYVWNIQRSLAIAESLKQRHPNMWIIFGGPQVPNDAEDFLRTYPFIDICCHGEGEQVFAEILTRYPERDWSGIPGISFLGPDGGFICHPQAPRLKDLNVLPSPYLTGVFRPLMRMNPHQWMALWETNRGCPFSCTFCDWGSAVQSKVLPFDLERVLNEVRWFARHGIAEIACCDANFGILKRDLEIATYLAESRQKCGLPHNLIVNTTKNQLERAYEIFKILNPMLSLGVTLSLQSTNQTTLHSIKRDNISLGFYRNLQQRLTRDHIVTYSDLILGLPGETYDSFAQGISDLLSGGQYNYIQFYNNCVLPNAEMAAPTYRQQYGIQTVKIPMAAPERKPDDPIQEYQEIVIATHTMSAVDWIKTKVLSWVTTLLYFYYQLFQVVLALMHRLIQVSHRDLIGVFLKPHVEKHPQWHRMLIFFEQKAAAIQQGESEQCLLDSPQSPPTYLWPEIKAMHELAQDEQRLQAVYQEGEALLQAMIAAQQLELPEGFLADAIHFNRVYSWQRFHRTTAFEIVQTYNIWDMYQGVLLGQPIEPVRVNETLQLVREGKNYRRVTP